MKLSKQSVRDALLHCHVSAESKAWLKKMKEQLNRPMGDIVDEIIAKARSEATKK